MLLTDQPNNSLPLELDNGATVLQAHIIDETSALVLCYWEQDDSIVSWLLNRETGSTVWGHYFPIRSGDAVKKASADFEKRVAAHR